MSLCGPILMGSMGQGRAWQPSAATNKGRCNTANESCNLPSISVSLFLCPDQGLDVLTVPAELTTSIVVGRLLGYGAVWRIANDDVIARCKQLLAHLCWSALLEADRSEG